MYIIDKEYNETWRTVKEEIKGTYLKEATLFPYVLLNSAKIIQMCYRILHKR